VQIAPKDGKAVMIMTLGQGKTVQEAANAVMQHYKLQPLESKEVAVNGLRALAVVADQQPQQQGQQAAIRTLSYFIEYGGNIYHLLGVSSIPDFNAYSAYFSTTMQSFRQLTDAAKINKKPERVRIKTVSQAATLEQVLRQYKVQDKRLEELAILNGMKLSDRLTQGMLIK
jgi:predicted Zn-dependent protease